MVGDGTAMYTIQGLWSAAHYDVPLVLVVMNNREYAACKRGIDRVVSGGGDSYVGMDLTDPEIDFIGLARSLGVEARTADEHRGALGSGLRVTRVRLAHADRRRRRRHTGRACGQTRLSTTPRIAETRPSAIEVL